MKKIKFTNVLSDVFGSSKIVSCTIFLAFAIFLTLLLSCKYFLFQTIITYDGISKKDVTAPKTIEVTDVFKTEQQRKEVAQRIAPILTPAEDAYIKSNLSALEKVDPEEVGLEKQADVLNGEVPTEAQAAKQDPDEQTRVIIVMEGDSVLDAGFDTAELSENEAIALSENIISEQEATVEKIEEEALEGEELDVNFNLSIVTNAVSADVAYKDIEKIKLVDGVAAVYVAQEYEPQVTADPMTITSGDMVGSYSTWATGYTGAGTRIAVIDTGIDSDHPSFDGAAFDAHLRGRHAQRLVRR